MLKRIIAYIISSAAGITAAFLLSGFFMLTEVTGSAMEPVLNEGSYVLINKAAYKSTDRSPDTGDIIAVKNHIYAESGEGSILLRRVAAASGDKVEIRNDILYINDAPCTEYSNDPASMKDMTPKLLKDGEIFLMSDDRRSLLDSRNEAIGVIQQDILIGKVCFK